VRETVAQEESGLPEPSPAKGMTDYSVGKQQVNPWLDTLRQFRRNRRAVIGAFIVVVAVAAAVFAPYVTPYDPLTQRLSDALKYPSAKHWLGTDEFGRDVFTRIVYGTRISLIIGLFGVAIAVVVGSGLGIIAGYYGGLLDNVTMRIMDVLMSFPSFLLALGIVTVLGAGLLNLILAIGIFSVPTFARIARGVVLSVVSNDYVEAARGMGANDLRVVLRHVIPNCMAPVIVLASMRMATAIITASGLSFLGLGVQPPTPEWGAMLSTGREYLRIAPHIATAPGMAIMLLVLGFNMFGDGLRDALDPRMKGQL